MVSEENSQLAGHEFEFRHQILKGHHVYSLLNFDCLKILLQLPHITGIT